LLRVIAGLEKQTEGEVSIASNGSGAESKVAMIFQEHGLFPWMSLRKNIQFVLENNAQFDAVKIKETIQHYINKVGLEKHADLYPHQVSGGMRQRISIARSFANNPDILLMDEPFVFLDYQSRMSLHELLLEIWQESGKTVVFVTHDIEEAVLLADRVLVLSAHPGQIRKIELVEIDRPRDLIEVRKNPGFIDQITRLTRDIKPDISGP
jgi:NitT/TauT family transport system ATP-binding protein